MNTEIKSIKILTSNPSSLGLFGLAMVTFIASTQKLGITDGYSMIIPWAIFLGGIAQIIASILDANHNNIFGTTAFGGFGLFWIAVSFSWFIKLGIFGEILQNNADIKQLGFAFIGYLFFSIYLTIIAMELNKVLFLLMIFIDILFISLSLSTFGIMSETFHFIGAVSEMIISLLGFYASGAAILNEHFGKIILSVGKPMGIIQKK